MPGPLPAAEQSVAASGDRQPVNKTAEGQCSAHFTPALASRLVRDLYRHRPAIYWADFLVSLTIGYSAAVIYLTAPLGSPRQVAAWLVAGFALFRVGSFIHEIVHLTGRKLLGFRVAWNLLAGIPMMMPSFFYTNHRDHHSPRHYGTAQDGEYLPLGNGPVRELAAFFAQVFLLPGFIFLRFLIGTPVSFLHPRCRQWILERASSFVINFHYRLQIPASAPRHWWALMDVACSLRAWLLMVSVLSGRVPWTRMPLLYLLGILALGLNYIRNVAAHRYQSDGRPMSHLDQLRDSVNLEGMPLVTELFFPLGLRYHALHHLLPTLPYHNLGKAHRRLKKLLPPDSPYHQTIVRSYWQLVAHLLRHAMAVSRHRDPVAQSRAQQWHARCRHAA